MKSPFVKFIVSKTFFKNFGLALLILLTVLLATQLVLKIYTGHGKEIIVPDFNGLPIQEVDKICYQKGLLWLIQDSVYVRDVAGGTVMEQYPAPGSRVKNRRKVFLTTNANFAEIIKMPKAYDMPLRQAQRILQNAGLVIEAYEYLPYFAENYVQDQKINGITIHEGVAVPKGTGITLVIGQGLSNERAAIPNLLNMCRDSAQLLSIRNFFNLGAVTFDFSVLNADDSMNARVYRQFPNHVDQQAMLGSSIDIWLTIDSLKLMQLDSMLISADTLLIPTFDNSEFEE